MRGLAGVIVAWTTSCATTSGGGGRGLVSGFVAAPPATTKGSGPTLCQGASPFFSAAASRESSHGGDISLGVASSSLFHTAAAAHHQATRPTLKMATTLRRRGGTTAVPPRAPALSAVSLPQPDDVVSSPHHQRQRVVDDAPQHHVPAKTSAMTTTQTTQSGSSSEKTTTSQRKKRVLILMSDTGGGHRASAQALAHALEHVYPDKIECEILDIWTEYAPWPYKNFVPYYAFLAKRPVLWRALWAYARFPLTRRLQEAMSLAQCYNNFREAVEERWPVDLVVSVHPLCQTIPLRVLADLDASRLDASESEEDPYYGSSSSHNAASSSSEDALASDDASLCDDRRRTSFLPKGLPSFGGLGGGGPSSLGLKKVGTVMSPDRWRSFRHRFLPIFGTATGRTTPFVTVVTDLGSAHPTWFSKKADACFVPSDAVRRVARRVGVPDDKIKQHGLPLREAFWTPEPRSKAALRQELNLPADQTTALVVGGGDGVGRISKLAKSIARELRDATSENNNHNSDDDENKKTSLVVICGKNAAAKRELEAHRWPDSVDATVLGFVSNMDEYMAAADCIVTKAGPGTIAEASTRRLPTLISSYLPGQEAGNVKFVTRDFKFGEYRRRPRRIAKTIKRWLRDDLLRSSLAERAESAATRDATTNIARDIGAFLFGDFGGSAAESNAKKHDDVKK